MPSTLLSGELDSGMDLPEEERRDVSEGSTWVTMGEMRSERG